jgi:hypothetical protein
MKKIFVDYFGVWASGRIGRTRFFALSIVSAVAGMVFSLALTVAAVSIGLLSNENIPTPVTDEVAQSFHLTALDYQTEAATGQFVTSNSVNAPWWLAAPVFHLFFANISMKRFTRYGPAWGLDLPRHTLSSGAFAFPGRRPRTSGAFCYPCSQLCCCSTPSLTANTAPNHQPQQLALAARVAIENARA